METKKNRQIYLVLVPHRDLRTVLQKKINSQIESGLKGVYRFPLAAPLARLSKALNADELKQIAKSLRHTIGKNKLRVNETAVTEFNEDMTLFGLRLELPCKWTESILSPCREFFPAVIGTYLLPKNTQEPALLSGFIKNDDEEFSLSFRAAAVANMSWQPVKEKNEIYFKWKIGKLYWLPRPE